MYNKALKIILIIGIVLFTGNIKAQSKIDSLKNQLKYSTVNNKIEIYYNLSVLIQDKSADTALMYANMGYALIDDNHGQHKKYDFLDLIGMCYERLNKNKLALKYLQQSLEGYEKENNKRKQIINTNSIGVVYGKTCYYDKALFYFQKALSMSNELKDSMQILTSYTNIGLVYLINKEYKQALSYFEKELELANRLNRELNIAHALNDISNIYTNLKNYKMSLDYHLKALDILKKLNKKRNIAIVNSGIGETYKKLKEYDKALKYLFEAYNLSIEFDDAYLKSHILYNIGDIYILKKVFDKAKEYLDKAESIATASENKETLRDIYESFSNYYSYNNDYKKSLEYYKRFKEANDSIFSKENGDKIAELQVKFEIQEIEKANEILRQKTEIQQLAINKQIYLRNTFIYISIIISLLVIFVFYRYWLKQRANKVLSEKNAFINSQKEELEEVYKTKDKLFAIITHDLKNPFNTIVTLSSFMETNYYSLEDNHKFRGIQSIKRSIANVNELLENLTDWLNSKGNNLMLSKTNFDLSSTIYSVIKLYKVQAEQKSIDLQMQIKSDIYAFGDERMIKTVLRNLIDNALKFTRTQGKIEVTISEENNKLRVAVADTGVGIDNTLKEGLFNLETSFSTEGTQYEIGGGLGLILSKEFIEKNDGEIWFESEVGKGSIFYFTIVKGIRYE